TSISGGNGSHTDPLQLHRYNVEPYPPRTFELVLSGACDLIALKDTVAGTHARRWFNAALGTSTKECPASRSRRTSPQTARAISACSARHGESVLSRARSSTGGWAGIPPAASSPWRGSTVA